MTGSRVARIDRVRIRFDFSTEHRSRTDQRGFVRVWGTVISADARLEYGPMDGVAGDSPWIELVPESTVFDPNAMATLRDAPVTFHHPPEPVTSSNAGRYGVGHIVDVQRRGDDLRALHLLTDERVIQAARSGIIQLSPGYTMLQVMGPEAEAAGVDAIQTAREYNHNSIVFEARAGEANALDKIDSADKFRSAFSVGELRISKPRNDTMATIRDNSGNEHEVSDEVAALFADTKAELDAAKAANDAKDESGEDPDRGDENGEGDDDDDRDDGRDSVPQPQPGLTEAQLDAKLDAWSTRLLTKMDKRRKADAARAKSRADLETQARTKLAASYSFDGKSDEQIMLDAMEAVGPVAKRKAEQAKSDASRLRGVFDAFIDQEPAQPRGDSTPLGGGSGSPGPDGDPIRTAASQVDARRAFIGRQKAFGRQAMDDAKVVEFNAKQREGAA